MWLPKDERHVLAAYYANVFDLEDRNVTRYLDSEKWFRLNNWTSVLRPPQWIPVASLWLVQRRARQIRTYGDSVTRNSGEDIWSGDGARIIAKTIQVMKRLEVANARLQGRQLVAIHPHQSEHGVAGIRLTLQGYDLARRYSRWFGRTGLWFREYKDHWLWLIVSFLGGIVGALVVQWLAT